MTDAVKSTIVDNICKLKFYRKKKDWKLAPEKEAEDIEKETVKVNENNILETSCSHNMVALEEEQKTDQDVQEIISDDEDDDMKSWCEERGSWHELEPVLLLSPQPQCHAVQPPAPQQQVLGVQFPAPQQQVLGVQIPAPQQQVLGVQFPAPQQQVLGVQFPAPQQQVLGVQFPAPQQQVLGVQFPAPQQQVLGVQFPAPQQQSPTNSAIRLPEPYVRAMRRLKHHSQEIVAVGNYEEFARGASIRRHSSEYDLTVLV